MELKDIVAAIRRYPGITRKRSIGPVLDMLKTMDDFSDCPVVTGLGEDAAALKYHDHYLLLAAEGMWPQFVRAEPYAAGKAAVMASVNDIYAMGGKPLAMVNVLSSTGEDDRRLIMEGIRKGCQRLKVPRVGGHVNPDAGETSLSVAILGTARRLLESTNARQGQKIVLAVDLKGIEGQCQSVESWDANSGKTSTHLVERLEILCALAEADLCRTAKDVSNGGILGTLAVLCECSRKGGVVDLGMIPQPPGVQLLTWLRSFLSYGFILCVDDANLAACLDPFHTTGIAAEVIGEVMEDPRLVLRFEGSEEVLYDFTRESLIGV